MGFSKESNFTNKTISESIVRPTSKPLKINEVSRTNFKLDSKGDFGGRESGLSIHSPRKHGDRKFSFKLTNNRHPQISETYCNELPPWLSGERIHLQRRHGFYPWVGKIPWRRKWQPSPVLFPGESRGRRRLVGYSPRAHKESDTTERLNTHSVMSAGVSHSTLRHLPRNQVTFCY